MGNTFPHACMDMDLHFIQTSVANACNCRLDIKNTGFYYRHRYAIVAGAVFGIKR